MKIHRAWIRATAAAALAAVGTQVAVGQYAPYGGVAPYPNQQPYSNVAPYGVPQAQPVPSYPTTGQAPQMQQVAYPTTTAAQPVYPQAQPQQPVYNVRGPQYPPTQYQAQRPSYPAIARQTNPTPNAMPQNGNVALPPQGESLPTPADGTKLNGEAVAPSYEQNYGGAGCNCSTYPSTGGYGEAGCGPDYGLGGYMDDCCDDGPTCFGGIYALYMTRDDPGYQRLAVRVDDNSATYPYYPGAQTTILSTNSTDYDYTPGVEVRFGCTFDVGSECDTCCDSPYGYGGGCGDCGTASCGSCAPTQTFAWEAAYWVLDDDTQWSTRNDYLPSDNYRIYGMKNFAGLQYNGANGAGTYRPVNEYYDYAMPIQDPVPPAAGDIRVVTQRVRTNWSAQNLELNFLRLPLLCGSTCSTGCNSCGYDACGGGCEPCGGCEPTCDSAFSLIGLCGVRYLRLDDSFEYANWYNEYDGAAWSSIDSLFYDVNVDNHLVGFQLGANMSYRVGCKCSVFWDTNFGLYNNYIESYQRVYGSGDVQNANGGSAAWASHKDDVAFLGEMRIGGAYDLSCNWRGVLAYRAIGLSGVALATDQIPNDFSGGNQVAWINSSGGLLLHGIQAGVECNY